MWTDLDEQDRRRRVLVLAVVTVLCLVAVLFVWQLARAVVALDRAGSTAPVLAAQVATGDVDGARASLDVLTQYTERARSHTDSPLWSVVARLPIVGDDVDAVRTVARELDRVTTEALPDVVDVADQIRLDAFTPTDGQVDLEAIESAAPVVKRTRAVLEDVNTEIQAVQTDDVVGRLQVPLRDVQRTLESATVAARAADAAGDLLPTMLGGEETRRYLLLIQNNAEVRTLGGIPGSVAILKADGGKVTMGRQGSAIDVRQVRRPVVDLTDGERAVFPTTLGTDIRNTTFSPDYPRAAEISADLAGDAFDVDLDGVVSVDPVTLAYLLNGIGSVTLDDGVELTADNATSELLNGVYLRYPTDLAGQDDVFAGAARRIFDRFVAGDGDVQAVLEGLVQAATDNRVMVWSDDDQEQERIAETGVAGLPPGGVESPDVGVWLNDALGGKMQYYLDSRSRLRSSQCLDEDRQRLELRTRLTSRAPADGSSLPLAITGLNDVVPKGAQRLNVRIATPPGGKIEKLVVDGEDQLPVGGTLDERQVAVVPVTLDPGATISISATMLTGPDQAGRPVLTTTPGIAPLANDVRVASACG